RNSGYIVIFGQHLATPHNQSCLHNTVNESEKVFVLLA
ncbi:MAG: hypothetical protein ACI88A_002588, partial [Paraglaciecola sp.]